ncbi:MAG: ribosomal subunit interface protein [Rickettsiales bacterium]|nr:ribosomal subunit interface protein [Rickettsiales bacterium]|tara:strand:- start:2091 stop:2621 length:531 start_codon:yes stop_codon:yes gene_type:complete
MKIIVKANHVDITQPLKDYADKKMTKLERFFDLIQMIKITLDIKSNSNGSDRQIVSAIIDTDTTVIVAKQKSADMYSSIDLVLDKLEVQLKKHKEKLKKHKGALSSSQTYSKEKNNSQKVTNNLINERYIKKPMDPEDAITIMQDEKLKVLVFRDMSERISVVFPVDDDEYGLITT